MFTNSQISPPHLSPPRYLCNHFFITKCCTRSSSSVDNSIGTILSSSQFTIITSSRDHSYTKHLPRIIAHNPVVTTRERERDPGDICQQMRPDWSNQISSSLPQHQKLEKCGRVEHAIAVVPFFFYYPPLHPAAQADLCARAVSFSARKRK